MFISLNFNDFLNQLPNDVLWCRILEKEFYKIKIKIKN